MKISARWKVSGITGGHGDKIEAEIFKIANDDGRNVRVDYSHEEQGRCSGKYTCEYHLRADISAQAYEDICDFMTANGAVLL